MEIEKELKNYLLSKELEDYLNSKEFENFIEEDIRKQEKREQELIKFKKKRIHGVIEEIDKVTDKNQVCDDDYTWEYTFSREEFDFLFEIVYDYADNKEKLYYDDENCFSTGIATIRYKNSLINFNRMVGQGTIHIISKLEIIEENKIIDFEEVLK